MSEGDGSRESWGLVLAFDSDSEEFARGIECGLLFADVSHTPESEPFSQLIHDNNIEMALRIADHFGRRVVGSDIGTEGWVQLELAARP
jgi:hypothetical protein